jgi:outer membrane lipoprotein-sorting protein
MGWMTFRKTALLLVFSFMMSGLTYAQSGAFDELRSKFENNRVFSADYTYEYIDSYTNDRSSSSGKIWIDSVGYKIVTEDQILVVDGEISKVYDAIKNRVIISEYEQEEDDFAPSKMLSGIDDTYIVSDKINEAGNTVIVLETDDDFADFVKVEIEVDGNKNPMEITAYDFADNMSITTFTNGIFLNKEPDMFTLSYPDDAEIVDMRY